MYRFYKLSASFRGTSFSAYIRTYKDDTVSTNEVTNIICEKLKATIPGSEISYDLAEATRADYEETAEYKADLTLSQSSIQ